MTQSPETTGLGTLLRHLIEQLDGDVEKLYRERGLDFRSRFTPIIRHLDRAGPTSIREISVASGVSHSAISQTVSEMLKRGLVISEPGKDGRERIISFTAKGKRALPELRRLWSAVWAASDDLSDEIGTPLPLVIGRALAALEDRSFLARISTKLGSDEKPGSPRRERKGAVTKPARRSTKPAA